MSGTAALHLALLLAGGPGDEVWVSPLAFVAPANAVPYVGVDLRFIDSEWVTWNMDPELLASELHSAAAADVITLNNELGLSLGVVCERLSCDDIFERRVCTPSGSAMINSDVELVLGAFAAALGTCDV